MVSPGPRTKRAWPRWQRLAGLALGIAALGIAIWLAHCAAHSKEIGVQPAAVREQPAPSVEVVRPRRGGIQRTIQQPASIHSFETVELYAMVSGYLKTQGVDIGSRIKKGQMLAEIDVPRDAKVVEEAAALVEQAQAQILQAEARVKMAEARAGRRRGRSPGGRIRHQPAGRPQEVRREAVRAGQRPGRGERDHQAASSTNNSATSRR